jgi:hypothetical protein
VNDAYGLQSHIIRMFALPASLGDRLGGRLGGFPTGRQRLARGTSNVFPSGLRLPAAGEGYCFVPLTAINAAPNPPRWDQVLSMGDINLARVSEGG